MNREGKKRNEKISNIHRDKIIIIIIITKVRNSNEESYKKITQIGSATKNDRRNLQKVRLKYENGRWAKWTREIGLKAVLLKLGEANSTVIGEGDG